MSCTRKGSGHTRLDSLRTYTVENLEFLDTPLATYPPTCGEHVQIQNYNDGTHCKSSVQQIMVLCM